MLPMDEAISMDAGVLVAGAMGRPRDDPLRSCVTEGGSAWVEAGKLALDEAAIPINSIEEEWTREVGDDLTGAIERGTVKLHPEGTSLIPEDVHIYTDGSVKNE